MPAELEYEIEVELQRLSLAPDDVTVHQTLRTVSPVAVKLTAGIDRIIRMAAGE
jgi:hypothetical protein